MFYEEKRFALQNIYLEEFLDKNIDLYKNYLGFYANGEV